MHSASEGWVRIRVGELESGEVVEGKVLEPIFGEG